MPLTDDDLARVRASLDHLRVNFAAHSTVFYDALFKRAPELRELFRDDLTGQGMKFMTTLDLILQKLDREDELEGEIAELGTTHRSLGVHAKDFGPMEEALIDTLREGMGEKFSPELESAWRKAYAELSANMIERGGIPD